MHHDSRWSFDHPGQRDSSSPAPFTDNALTTTTHSMLRNDNLGHWIPKSDPSIRNSYQGNYGPMSLSGNGLANHFMDSEIAELYSRSRSQEEEILLLRKQIADACHKELELLYEKHVLERKFSDLRMTLDEKHNNAISEAVRDLINRKSYLEENLKLADELKVMEAEKYIFTSSLLALLAEYEIRPPIIDASSISNNTKRLFHQMQWKIQASQASMVDVNNLLGNQLADAAGSAHQLANGFRNQLPQDYMVSNAYAFHNYSNDMHMESPSNPSRFVGDHDMMDVKDLNPSANAELHFPFNSDMSRDAEGRAVFGTSEDKDIIRHQPTASYDSDGEVLPGIEGFQIIGDPRPGSTLTACGYPSRGTSVCMFQWVRHLQNGTRQYIEGATNPEYVVTADDVDKLVAVECIPMNDSGRQGELVRHFANSQSKITCDPEMQHEIQRHVSQGRAIFSVLLLKDSLEKWEPTTLLLKRSGYQIKINHVENIVIEEKYSADLSIKVPYGLSTQFVLTCSDGTSYPFKTDGISFPLNIENDLRMRDIIVLTMRIFQTKALDDKRKGKA